MNHSRDHAVVAHGLTELHIAVISGNIRQVSKIVARGNKTIIETADMDGTTPLMAAVLAGRLAIFRLLLRSGASPHAKDRRGRRALDYSRSRHFEKKLRAYRRLGLLQSSRKQDRRRTRIARILRHAVALESCRRGGNHQYSQAVLYKDGRKLKVVKPDITFKIGKGNLNRGTTGFVASARHPAVTTAAVSGWQPNPGRGANVLSNTKYFRLVQEVAKLLNFRLIGHLHDKNRGQLMGQEGWFVTSHVEKKLAVFWIVAALKSVLNTTDIGRMGELREAAIPEPLQEALIILDHTPCENCWDFLQGIERATGLRIYVERRPFLVRGHREGPAGCKMCHCNKCRRKFEGQKHSEGAKLTPDEHGVVADEDMEGNIEASGGGSTGPNLESSSEMRIEVDSSGSTAEGNGENGSHPRESRKNTAPEVPPPTPCPGSRGWKHYDSDLFGLYAKPPRPTPLQHPGALDDNALGFHDPVSTIAGRSAFFPTPNPPSSLEVQLPMMSPEIRAGYNQISVSDISGPASTVQQAVTRGSSSASGRKRRTSKQTTTIQQSTRDLNLRRFAYNCRGSPAIVPKKRSCRGSANSTGGVSNKATKTPKTRRTRSRQAKNERFVARSAFARAVEHHWRQRAEKV